MMMSGSDTPNSLPPPKTKRLYQVWKGRNKFCCGGRLVFGADGGSVILSTILIGAPAITFCIKMFFNIKNDKTNFGFVELSIGIILTLLDLIFLFMTSASNPGIVRRNKRPPEYEESFDFRSQSLRWMNGSVMSMRIPRIKDMLVNGHTIKVKYCDTCMLYRPPRASHCSVCNNCVQRFDHHCPWVGQCIGGRNYRFFIVFIMTSTALCIYVFTFSLIDVIRQHGSLWNSLSKDAISVALVGYSFVCSWFVGGLCVFHIFLISTNQTTYENFRYRYEKKKNPYNEGFRKNLKDIFGSKLPPAIDFREWVTVEEEDEDEDASMSHRFGGSMRTSKIKLNGEPKSDKTLPKTCGSSAAAADKDLKGNDEPKNSPQDQK
ncbi:probable protein S-acyltransferase 3 isoform X1 [Lactuca sativa]|uniref:S-acyltransferase n=2 Tax=Lactuca sativa TaxID=4236 RepID=A0A9R1UR36_LACSA|nr:probable protein S-acyltransferase 3 isoform X1 [Lactuca sativa]KAJ0191400.1 hypothetical protein LSAT_V11C800422730 [Lactuca sativa]